MAKNKTDYEIMRDKSMEELYHYGLDADGKRRKMYISEEYFNKMSIEEHKEIVILYPPQHLASKSWMPKWW